MQELLSEGFLQGVDLGQRPDELPGEGSVLGVTGEFQYKVSGGGREQASTGEGGTEVCGQTFHF